MEYTVPNQRVIKIHREIAKQDFLGIKNSNWQAAARDLGAHALMLYLYFASNKEGYELALSPVAIRQAIGMPTSTYRDQFVKLIDKGYLVQRGDGNTYDFYETPQRGTCVKQDSEDAAGRSVDGTAVVEGKAPLVHHQPPEDREINNKYSKNNINNCGGEKQVSPAPRKEFVF